MLIFATKKEEFNSNLSIRISFSIGSLVFLQFCFTTLHAAQSFHGCLYSKHLDQRAGMLTVFYKRFRFPNFRVPLP